MNPRWPSPGFVALASVWLGLVGLVAWGLAEPPLDRVWRLHQELRAGARVELSPAERAELEAALRSSPGLLADWLEGEPLRVLTVAQQGWLPVPGAVLVRGGPRALSRRVLTLDVQAAARDLPLMLVLEVGGFRQTLEIARLGAFDLPLPEAGPGPEILVLTLRGPKGRALHGPPGVRLRIPG
jgi:hypothetical protein